LNADMPQPYGVRAACIRRPLVAWRDSVCYAPPCARPPHAGSARALAQFNAAQKLPVIGGISQVGGGKRDNRNVRKSGGRWRLRWLVGVRDDAAASRMACRIHTGFCVALLARRRSGQPWGVLLTKGRRRSRGPAVSRAAPSGLFAPSTLAAAPPTSHT
jgi:hypothetical protein